MSEQLKQKPKISILGKLWVFLAVLVAIVMLLAACAFAGVRVVGFTPVAVNSDALTPELAEGDLAYFKQAEIGDANTSDIVVYADSSDDETEMARVTRVDTSAKTLVVESAVSSATKTTRVSSERLVGKVEYSVPYLGYAYDYLSVEPGLYVGVAAGVLLAILFFVMPFVLRRRTVKRYRRDLAEKAALQAQQEAPAATVERPVLKPELVPSPAMPSASAVSSQPMVASALPMGMRPQTAVASAQPVAFAAQQPISFTATVIMPSASGSDGSAAWAAPQLILRVGEAVVGEAATAAEVGMRTAEDVARLSCTSEETSEDAQSEPAQVHDGAALPYDEHELQRAEEELRAAEEELNAMRSAANQVEVGFLRAQAEIKLAEAELLRARAEILEKKRAAAQVVEPKSSDDPEFNQLKPEAESAE